MNKLIKLSVLLIKKTALLSALACRLVKLTGKYPEPIHPKHLVAIRPIWYLPYIKKTDTVLDLGCNNGQHTLKIARKSKQVFGIDYDEKMLSIAKREIKRTQIRNITVMQGNIEKKLPFKPGKFDVIVFLDVLEHLYNREQVLIEIKRTLKPQGILLLSIPNSNTSWKRLQKRFGISYYSDPDHKVEYTKKEITLELKKAGFEVVNLTSVTLDTPWVGFIDLMGGISFTLYKKLSTWRRNAALRQPEESIGFEIVCKRKSL